MHDEELKRSIVIGDRVTWHRQLGGTCHSSAGESGEVVRIDVLKGRVWQYIVFNDYAEFVVVGKSKMMRLHHCGPRISLPKAREKFLSSIQEGSVVHNGITDFVVGCILPNKMLLPELSEDYPNKVPFPQWMEYLSPVEGARRRKSFRSWRDDSHNPYILRLSRPDGRPKRPLWNITGHVEAKETVEEVLEYVAYGIDIVKLQVVLKLIQLRDLQDSL